MIGSNLAPPDQVSWSGQNWYRTSGLNTPTIAIIDRKSESYEEYHERRKREEGAPRVPFGFSRVLGEVKRGT